MARTALLDIPELLSPEAQRRGMIEQYGSVIEPVEPTFTDRVRNFVYDTTMRFGGNRGSALRRAGMAEDVIGVSPLQGITDYQLAKRAYTEGDSTGGDINMLMAAASLLPGNERQLVSGFSKAGDEISGLRVGDRIKNQGSISATFDDGEYDILEGVREIPLSEFEITKPGELFYAKNDIDRARKLAEEIKNNQYLDPLIVVRDDEGMYVLEGAHRLGAASELGLDSVPAQVVDARTDRTMPPTPRSALNDLDMNYGARMQRAAEQEYGRDVYHGTLNEFDEFDPSEVDIGVHVGTYEQANNRLRDLYGESSGGSRFSGLYQDGANVMPLKAKIQNPLVMEDVGDWKNSYEVLVGLRNTPAFSHKAGIIEDMIQEADDLQFQFEYGEELWRDSQENREFLDEIRQMIKDEGYDSVQYANKVENQYSGESGFTRTADAMLRQKSQEISMLEQFVRDKMPQPPDPSDPLVNEKMRRFLDAKFEDYATTEELSQIEKLKNEYRAIANDPSSKNDTNSYIVLDPENLRSVNAKFDPREKGSSNILAGIAGGSLVGGSALSGQRQENNN